MELMVVIFSLAKGIIAEEEIQPEVLRGWSAEDLEEGVFEFFDGRESLEALVDYAVGVDHE